MMLQYVNYWVRTVRANKHNTNRQANVLVADLTGKSVLIVRYIHPQAPPPTLTTEDSIIR